MTGFRSGPQNTDTISALEQIVRQQMKDGLIERVVEVFKEQIDSVIEDLLKEIDQTTMARIRSDLFRNEVEFMFTYNGKKLEHGT